MDYTRLRAAALRDGEDEEAVTVDTRALIDKVLARYSGEWTTLRELIQNAADAQATTVKIKWETLPSTRVPVPADTSDMLGHTIQHHTLRRLLVENDGQPFTATDWARLKRIAEGNPDETKIGAFGVGFYSVFADCEEPFVSSGPAAMAFYWKGNALFTRKLALPAAEASSATTFVLDYRSATTALPNLLSVSQFLATSLTFVALQRIEFWIDGWRILDLRKTLSPSASVALPPNLDTRTRDGLMTVAAVERSSAQIDATLLNAVGWKPHAAATPATSATSATPAKTNDSYGLSAGDMPSLRTFFSRLTGAASSAASAQASARSKAAREEKAAQEALQKNLTGETRSTIFLRVTSAQVTTRVSSSFAAELTRATKKPPPKTTKMAILTSSYDDERASSHDGEGVPPADVFASVLPSKKPGGRIFIGFPTMQTTGGGLHVSAPSLIPTVEREAIDLNARWVRSWNMELLRVAGILARLSYIQEMLDLDIRFRRHLEGSDSKKAAPSAADLARFVPEALHILKTYSLADSTPSSLVGQIIDEAFWTASKMPSLDLFSSRGVLSTTKVRMADAAVSQFADGIPVVVKAMEDCVFVRRLHDFGILQDVTIPDVRAALEARPLDRTQLTHFVKWIAAGAASGELDPPSVRLLLQAAVATFDDDDDNGILELRQVKHFLSGNKIPASLPLPPSTIPFAVTSAVPQAQLSALGWQSLELTPWLEFLVSARGRLGDARNLTLSPAFAAQVLTVLSKNWDNLAAPRKMDVVILLAAHTTMPTRAGMKRPADAFFPSVKLFDDLPVIAPSCHSLKEKFLDALGVRKTIDLDTIFTRLLASGGGDGKDDKKDDNKWSHVELVKYLTSVRADIPAADRTKLRESAFCPAEAGPAGQEATVPSTKLYRPRELYEPSPELRALGFPLMQWPGGFRRNSPEARFLQDLGLRAFPPLAELLHKMALPDKAMRDRARAYFIANHQLNGYASFSMAKFDQAILPVTGDQADQKGDAERLEPPSACFTNPAAAVLGFPILRTDLHPHAAKFGVSRDPPILACVQRLLARPPPTHAAAVVLFGYFSSRLGDLAGDSLRLLQESPFVPVTRANTTVVEHLCPSACYLGSSTAYGDIFAFVDFGVHANAFLFQCGSRTEPTKVEIARRACSEPARLLSTLQTPERYLNLLRSLAEDLPQLKADRTLFRQMKTAPFLLASREIGQPAKTKHNAAADDDDNNNNEEETPPVRQYQLVSASQIAVPDDYISYQLFKDKLLCAPEEDVLESFYLALGAQMLSSIVQEEVRIAPSSTSNPEAKAKAAAALRAFVLERSKIFLHEYQKYRRDAIKHDHAWLEKRLQVEMVAAVTLRRSLRGSAETHTEKRSASAGSRTSSGTHVLYVVAAPDMYQVGQAVCQLVLNRPSQQAYFFFEPFLKLGLLDLRARGYNVDRILRAKAAEARIAEAERQKALAAEQQRIRDADTEWQQQQQQQQMVATAARAPARPRSPEVKMPGAFGDDSPEPRQGRSLLPPSMPALPNANGDRRGGHGFFSSLTKRLGLDAGDDNNHPGPSDNKPGPAPSPTPGPTPGPTGNGGQVMSPAAMQRDMLNAIKATRPFGASTLFEPPRSQILQETATYCDSQHAHDLAMVAQAPGGMPIFLDNGEQASDFLSTHTSAIAAFESLLRDVAAVYSLAPGVLHMYFDADGPTIAFNTGGSLFCNLRFFIQLHARSLPSPTTTGQARVDAAVWWWVVVAHELAHNLETSHNARHSYYTESFVQQYFHKMTARATGWLAQPATPAAPSMPPSYQQATQRPTNLMD